MTREEDRERRTGYEATYREKHRTELRTRARARYAADPQKDVERHVAWRKSEVGRQFARERCKRWRRLHPGAAKEYDRAYRRAHLERYRVLARGYWNAHRLERNVTVREKRRANPAPHRLSVLISEHKRRAASGHFTRTDLEIIVRNQAGRCWWCRRRLSRTGFHIDHRQPLARGGDNNPSNIVLACPRCNMKKSARLPHEFCGRLL